MSDHLVEQPKGFVVSGATGRPASHWGKFFAHIVLPTALEPTLRIRDYGRGLSEEDVFDVYTHAQGRGINGRPYREW
mgnify:CR=1 FL=1